MGEPEPSVYVRRTGDQVSENGWRGRLAAFANDLQDELDQAGRKLGLIGGGPKGYEIVAYRSYGSRSRVLVQGRVVECRRFAGASKSDSVWTNLLNTYRRMDAAPQSLAKVRVDVGGREEILTADNEGFFRAWVELAKPVDGTNPWYELPLAFDAPDGKTVSTKALVRVPAGEPAFGIISDLDDTVIQSRVTSFLQAVRTVMLGNALTRLPFPGPVSGCGRFLRGARRWCRR
jgi:phosphatidate phosphatase APP1